MDKVGADAKQKFDQGLYCAESVLAAIADHYGIASDLIPGIANGFCSGLARTCGPCGAVSGAILALNMMLGRSTAEASVDPNSYCWHGEENYRNRSSQTGHVGVFY